MIIFGKKLIKKTQNDLERKLIIDQKRKLIIDQKRKLIQNGNFGDIKDYNDTQGLQEFYNYCNETIENYNKIAR